MQNEELHRELEEMRAKHADLEQKNERLQQYGPTQCSDCSKLIQV